MPRKRSTKPKPVVAERASASLVIIVASPGGPPIGYQTGTSRRYGRETHPLIGSDVNRVQQALLTAFAGNPSQLQDLYDDARDRDQRLDAVCRTRVLAIQSRPWSVSPPVGLERNAEALRQASECARIIREIPSWPTRVGELAHGKLNGYALSEIVWGSNARGYHAPTAICWVHPNRIRFDDNLEIQIVDAGSGSQTGTPLAAYGPDKFLCHSPAAGRAAYIVRRGALIACMFASLTKRYGIRWWLKAAERFGQPAPYAVLPSNADDADRDKAKEMLRQLTADWQAVLSEGMEIKSIEGSTGQFTGEAQARLVELVNTDHAIQILGQNLTTEVKGGSFAAATTHDFVRGDILAADLAEEDADITAQLVEPIYRYNWPGAPVGIYETTRHAADAFTAVDVQLGVCTIDEYRISKGHQPMADGRGNTIYVPPTQYGQAPQQSALSLPPLPSGGTAPSGDRPFSASSAMPGRSTHPLMSALRLPSGNPAS